MIILHAANFDRKQSYRAMYNCDYKIHNGLIRSGHAVYSFSDRDVARDSNALHIRKLGQKIANHKFLNICKTIRPDFIILGHADVVTNETLAEARTINPSLKIAYYNVDPLFVPKNFNSIMGRSGVVDTIYITTGGAEIQQFSQGGSKAFFMPNPVDASLETGRAFESDEQKHDVVFCTVRSKITDARVQFMLQLKEKLPDVSFGLYGMLDNPSVFGAEYMHMLVQAKMAVSINKTCGMTFEKGRNHLYSSDRLAQITGNGLLTFIEYSTGFQDLYTGDEVAFFHTVDDLAEKVAFYKKNPAERQRIAKNGWEKAHTHFNEQLIARYIVETTFGLPLSHRYSWAGM